MTKVTELEIAENDLCLAEEEFAEANETMTSAANRLQRCQDLVKKLREAERGGICR